MRTGSSRRRRWPRRPSSSTARMTPLKRATGCSGYCEAPRMITIVLTACAVAVLIVAAVLMRRRIRAHGSEHGRAEAAADYVAMFMVTMYTVLLAFIVVRSEERRVGKECRCRW